MIKGRQNKDMGQRKNKKDKIVIVCPLCRFEREVVAGFKASCPKCNRLMKERK